MESYDKINKIKITRNKNLFKIKKITFTLSQIKNVYTKSLKKNQLLFNVFEKFFFISFIFWLGEVNMKKFFGIFEC